MLKFAIVPLIAALMMLPLMIVTSLLFMAVAAMPAIVKFVGERDFPDLEKKSGGTFIGGLIINISSFLLFIPLWLVTMPLYVIPPLGLAVQVTLWGWLTARVMSYDALADHASADEFATIVRRHRRHLTLIGMCSGAAGALPGIVWVGGAAVTIVLFPVLALIAVWIYLLIFIFTALWFQYFCMQALADLRAAEPAVADVQVGIVAH
jgi:hypothetical protein